MRDEIFIPVLQPPSPLATTLFNKIVPQACIIRWQTMTIE